MKVIVKKMRHKSDNVRFWMYVKKMWGSLYYSADGERTWHLTKTEAYRYSRENGNLALITAK